MNEENTEGLFLESKLSIIRGRGGGIKSEGVAYSLSSPEKWGGGGRIRDGVLFCKGVLIKGFTPYFG